MLVILAGDFFPLVYIKTLIDWAFYVSTLMAAMT